MHYGATARNEFGGLIEGDVTYASSNPAVATVDATTGAITAVSPGSATITSTCTSDPSVTQTVILTIRNNPVELILQKAGDGDGFLISNPPLGTGFFEAGTQVTVTINPNADSIFTGWGGACSGTGACVVTMREPGPMTVIANLALRRFVGAVPPTIMGSVSGTGNAGCVWEVSASGSFSVQMVTNASGTISGTTAGTLTTDIRVTSGGSCTVNPSTIALTGTVTGNNSSVTAVASTPGGQGFTFNGTRSGNTLTGSLTIVVNVVDTRGTRTRLTRAISPYTLTLQ